LTKRYGLIGYPLTHSFSPSYFNEKYRREHITDTTYDIFPLEQITSFPELIATGVAGLNVTIPYKEQVIPYLDELSEACSEIKAVNTIKIKDGKLYGYNTDVIGFEQTLLELLDGAKPTKALVLGTGGAAKAIVYVLKSLGIKYTYISRKRPHLTYDELNQELIEAHKLIINTTPLGMSPQDNTFPDIPFQYLGNEHFLYDLVYNPEKTIFLTKGVARGARTKNGYDMLIKQAEASWDIWNQP